MRVFATMMLLLAACSGSQATSADARPTTTDGTENADAARPLAMPSIDEVRARFGTIETIAGTAQEEDKGENGWLGEFEGGSATAAELSRPHITLSDAAGNLYIADKDANAVRRVTPQGVITTVAGTGVAGDDGDAAGVATERRLSAPNGLWVQPDGTFYVLDLGNDKVRKVTSDGTMTTLFVIGGAGTGRGLWVRDDENEAFISAGGVLRRWTPSTGTEVLAGGFSSLGNLVVTEEGVYVADRLAHRVYRVTRSGDITPIAGTGQPSGGRSGDPALEIGFNEVRGLWPYPDGGFFLATHKGGQIWYLDTAGNAHVFVDGDANDSHAGDGERFDSPLVRISEPRAVTMDSAGNLIITEHDGGYVRRVNAAN